jgi:hypothetical protein
MNTKQFLYDTLKAQLDIRQQECDQYNKNTYTPAMVELKTKVNRWFVDNIKATYDEFDYNGSEIEIISSDSDRYNFRVRLANRYEGYNKKTELNIMYSSANVGSSVALYINHIKLLNELVDKYSTISDLFENTWKVQYNEINNNKVKFEEDYKTLNSALNTLSLEIRDDKLKSMLEIGYESTSFKKSLHCTYENELVERSKSIELQYGRSKYDTTYTHGFKVLNKKGNKYKIVVYFEDGRQREYDVLEKKFKDFVDKVYTWEYDQADKSNEKETKRYESKLKAA